MLELLNRFWKEEEGQDLVEYALIVALIALAIIATFPQITSAIKSAFGKVADNLTSPPQPQ